jgi:hypothetical protein
LRYFTGAEEKHAMDDNTKLNAAEAQDAQEAREQGAQMQYDMQDEDALQQNLPETSAATQSDTEKNQPQKREKPE